jgi:hypothetical protein
VDTFGCRDGLPFSIDQPEPLLVSSGFTPLSEIGASDAQVFVNATGGTPPYTVTWSGSFPQTDTLTGVPAGTYPFFISDENGCSELDIITVPEAPCDNIQIDSIISVPICGGVPGLISVFPSGGNGQLFSIWNDTLTADTYTSTVGGTVSLTIQDEVGCELTEQFTLETSSEIQFDSFPVFLDESRSNGIITLFLRGGTAPYEITWLDLNGDSVGSRNDNVSPVLPLGAYYAEIKDAVGCVTQVGPLALANSNAYFMQAGIQVSVYPNPSHGIFTLEIESSEPQPFRFELRNKLGQHLQTGQMDVQQRSRRQIDVHTLACMK